MSWFLKYRRTAIVMVLMVGLIGAWGLWFLYWAPLIQPLSAMGPLTTVYLDSKGRVIAELAGSEARSHRPISLTAMGPWVPEITVALEDQRFYSHHGVDFFATARALVRGHGGGSTITMQLVKVATARKGRSLWAKAREMLLALQLERRWTKQQILEAYLNRIPYGNRLIGIEAAAQVYFNKSAASLNKAEAIYLAGLPRKPSRFNPLSHPDAAARQFENSRQLLVTRGAISAVENAEFSLPQIGRHFPENIAPHFINTVAKPGQNDVVLCTLDLDIQSRVQQLLHEHLDMLHRSDITQAAVVVIENDTGAVRALIGSRDFSRSEINGALRFHDCGSTLKPFLYVTGIDRRIFTAATLLPDTADAVRDAYGDYDPHNFVMNHLGPVRVREALGNSLNVPAVVAVSKIGARKAYDSIGEWGIKFDRPLEKAGAGFILGNVGVRLLDLTAAFAGLARGGLAAPPRLLATEPMPLRRLVSPEAASIITDILCDNTARLHGFGPHSALAFSVRVAGKTGTSAGFRDAWAVGFTREHTVGVWVGNFDGSPMDHAASISSAAPLWRRIMDDLLQTDHPLPEPKLARVQICALSGLLPCKASPATVGELFLPGTQPHEHADAWFAPDGHPLLPAEYAGWCASADNFLQASIQPAVEQLAIITPRDGAIFVLDDHVPLAQQQMEFQASLPNTILWKVNGEAIVPRSDGRVMWNLREGEWTLEAASGSARVTSKFVVRRN